MNNVNNIETIAINEEVIEFNDTTFEAICEANWGTIEGINYDAYYEPNDLNDNLLRKIFNLDPDTNDIFSNFSTTQSSCVKNVIYNSNNKNLSNTISSIEVTALYYIVKIPSSDTTENIERLKLFRERSWDFIRHLNDIVMDYPNWSIYSFVAPYYQYKGEKMHKGYPADEQFDSPNDWPYTTPVTILYMNKPDESKRSRVLIFVGTSNDNPDYNNTSVLDSLNSIILSNFKECLKHGTVIKNDIMNITETNISENKHMVLFRDLMNDGQISITTKEGSILELLNSEALELLYELLSNPVESDKIKLDNSLIIQKQLSPDMNRSDEITYYKSSKDKKLNRFIGKISPYFISRDDKYKKNFYNYKLTTNDLSIPQKLFQSYKNKNFQPIYPSLGYYLIGSDEKLEYQVKNAESPKIEYHVYLDNRIIKLDSEMNLTFSTDDTINNNIRDYVYSVFETRYSNVLGDKSKDPNNYEKMLKYITEQYKVVHSTIDAEIKNGKYYTTYNIKINLK